MNGSIIAVRPRPASWLTALAQGDHGGRILGIDADEHLASVPAGGLDARRVISGEPVVHLERRPGQAAPVHRTDDHFLMEGAKQEQVLEDVRSAEHAVDAGPRQCEA